MNASKKIIYTATWFMLLSGFWLVLSGHFSLLFLCYALLSVTLVMRISARLNLIDILGANLFYKIYNTVFYLPYICSEIICANLDVCRRILNPKLPIQPQTATLKLSIKDDFFKVLYANSITLTPGTVTLDVAGDNITVHALSSENIEQLSADNMSKRIQQIEDKMLV